MMPTESITSIQQHYVEGKRKATQKHEAGGKMKEHWHKNNVA